MFLFTLSALASGINNPGGERIPYVKLQSESWDVVIRMTGEGRARIERVKGMCQQGMWVNGCAAGVDPELRQLAINGVFQDQIQLSGDFTYCSTAVVRGVPVDLARDLIRGDTASFCQVFLDPESVRGQRSGNATKGENNLVNRLMGGQNTTSGQLRMKAPPTLDGTEATEERGVTGERRTAADTRNNTRQPVDKDPKPGKKERVAKADRGKKGKVPTPPAPPSQSGVDDDDDWFEQPEGMDPVEELGLRGSQEPGQVAQSDARLNQQGVRGSSKLANTNANTNIERQRTPRPAPAPDLLGDEEEDDIFRTPPPKPAAKPKPMDPELAALLAPLPGLPEEDQVVVPAPRPVKQTRTTTMSEFDRLAQEDAALQRLSRGSGEDDKKTKKAKDKEQKKADAEKVEVGTDEDFGDYIIVDIESLPDE